MLKRLILVLLLLGVCGKPTDLKEKRQPEKETIQRFADQETSEAVPSASVFENDLVRFLRSIKNPAPNHAIPRRWTPQIDHASVTRSRKDVAMPQYQKPSHRTERALDQKSSKLEKRRGVNVGIDIGTVQPKSILDGSEEDIMRLLEKDLKPILMQELNQTSMSIVEEAEKEFASDMEITPETTRTTGYAFPSETAETVASATLCEECKEVENLIIEEKKHVKKTSNLLVRPTYPCDDWDAKSRTCYIDRNTGDTVTFVLTIQNLEGLFPHIVWRQEFHLHNSNARKELILDPGNPPWNIVIGTRGHEFRMSPITEIDLDFNRFSATVHTENEHEALPETALNKVTFQIRTVAIDLGFVYPGEALTLNVRSFVSLPMESMAFKWFLERDGEASTLPSNMRTSPSGGSVAISELRKEQEGVLTCSVYTNKGIFATKKRFLIKELNTDVLMVMPPQEHSELEEYTTEGQKVLIRRARQESTTKHQKVSIRRARQESTTKHPKVLIRRARQAENDDEMEFANMDRNIEAKNESPPEGLDIGTLQSEQQISKLRADDVIKPRLVPEPNNLQSAETNAQIQKEYAAEPKEKGGVVEVENNNGYPQIIPVAGEQVVLNPEQSGMQSIVKPDTIQSPQVSGQEFKANFDEGLGGNLKANEYTNVATGNEMMMKPVMSNVDLQSNVRQPDVVQQSEFSKAANEIPVMEPVAQSDEMNNAANSNMNSVERQPVFPSQNIESDAMNPTDQGELLDSLNVENNPPEIKQPAIQSPAQLNAGRGMQQISPLESLKRVNIVDGVNREGNRDENGLIMEIEKNIAPESPRKIVPPYRQMPPNYGRVSSGNRHGVPSRGQLRPNDIRMRPSYGPAGTNHIAPNFNQPLADILATNPEQMLTNHEKMAPNYGEAAMAPNLQATGSHHGPGQIPTKHEIILTSHDKGDPSQAVVETEKAAEESQQVKQVKDEAESGFMVDIEKAALNREVRAEDKVSQLIAECRRDAQCSGNAVCIHRGSQKTEGFCRCHAGYHGNGIFCWEDTNIRSVSSDEENIPEKRRERGTHVENESSSFTHHGKSKHRRMNKA